MNSTQSRAIRRPARAIAHDEAEMLIYHRTSILESNAQTVVNTVNCVGVMGKGIAADFKMRFPAMFEAYRAICDQGLLEPGKLWLWKGPDQWVLNFPTKKHWRNPSRLEWIELGLQKFVAEHQQRGITQISFPRLGCGNGNLEWDDVRPVMERYLAPLPIDIYVHDFEHDIGVPEHLEQASGASCASVFDGSFDKFKDQLDLLVANVGSHMVDLDTHERFSVRATSDGLQIHASDRTSLLDPEDLRGVWSALLTGVLTQDKLGWAKGEEASHLLSLVSLMPCVKPIQIQRMSSAKPELAVQLRRSLGAVGAETAGKQIELSWG